MKIAFLHFWTLRLPRGVETLTLSLANALAELGEDVSILTARRTREPLVVPSPKVRVQEFPTFRYYEALTIVPFFANALIRGRYDVVVTFFADFGEGPALALARRLCRFQHILYLTFPYGAAPHRYAAYQKYGWERSADLILADAAYTAQDGARLWHREISLLPSGTDPHRFAPNSERRAAMRRKLGFDENHVVLLNVSALERRKGTWRIIEVLPQLLSQHPNVRYLVLGDGPERESLERRAEELQVHHAVVFAGTTADLPPYYNASDIFVMLPDSEAGSIALLEAMSSGLPVVVADAGGFAEVVSHRCGRQVNIDDPPAIESALLELVAHPDTRSALGIAARGVVQERFGWEALARQLLDMLETALRTAT